MTYSTTVLSLSPDAYWRLGEASGNPADSSGNGLTLTATGTPGYGVTGWAGDGDAMSFNGGSDQLSRADNAVFDFGTNDYSIVWAHSVASGNWSALNDKQIMGHPGQGYDGDWWIRFSGIEDRLYLYQDGEYINFNTSSNSLDTGDWVWCCITVDRSGNATLYVNGTSLDAGAEYTVDVSAWSADDVTTAQSFYIADNGANTKELTGSLDEIAIWNGTLLSQSQVQTLYDARNATANTDADAEHASLTVTGYGVTAQISQSAEHAAVSISGYDASAGLDVAAPHAAVAVSGYDATTISSAANEALAGHASITIWSSEADHSDLEADGGVAAITLTSYTVGGGIAPVAGPADISVIAPDLNTVQVEVANAGHASISIAAQTLSHGVSAGHAAVSAAANAPPAGPGPVAGVASSQFKFTAYDASVSAATITRAFAGGAAVTLTVDQVGFSNSTTAGNASVVFDSLSADILEYDADIQIDIFPVTEIEDTVFPSTTIVVTTS